MSPFSFLKRSLSHQPPLLLSVSALLSSAHFLPSRILPSYFALVLLSSFLLFPFPSLSPAAISSSYLPFPLTLLLSSDPITHLSFPFSSPLLCHIFDVPITICLFHHLPPFPLSTKLPHPRYLPPSSSSISPILVSLSLFPSLSIPLLLPKPTPRPRNSPTNLGLSPLPSPDISDHFTVYQLPRGERG